MLELARAQFSKCYPDTGQCIQRLKKLAIEFTRVLGVHLIEVRSTYEVVKKILEKIYQKTKLCLTCSWPNTLRLD